MIKNLLECLVNMDSKTFRIVNFGFGLSFLVCLIGILFVLTYNTYPTSYDFYQGGLILFRTGISFIASFLSCGIVFDKLSKEKGGY